MKNQIKYYAMLYPSYVGILPMLTYGWIRVLQ